jgi:hypothetical protein
MIERERTMTTYHIYTGYNNNESTAQGATFLYDGINPADALAKFIADESAITEARELRKNETLTELTASDDDMVASVYPCDDGTWELHIYVDESDTAITIPPTEYVSITDAADMLGITRQRVHVMLQHGQLFGRKVGNAWMIARASVIARLSNR